MNEVGGHEQKERGIRLVTVQCLALALQEIVDSNAEDVDHADSSALRDDGCERFLMANVPVRGEENELAHSFGLPRIGEVVEGSQERLATQRCIANGTMLGLGVDPVLDRRGPQNSELRREVIGEVLDDERVAPKGEMGTMLLAGPDGNDEPRIAQQTETNQVGDDLLDSLGLTRV